MSALTLKIIALVTMIIDHIGAIFFPQFIWIRYIGRISFPIYAFLLAQGFIHTHSRTKYAIRLFIFGIISEVPHDLAFHHEILDTNGLNIMFELFLGVLALACLEVIKDEKSKIITKLLSVVGLALVLFSSAFFGASYGIYGIALMIFFYLFDSKQKISSLTCIPVTYTFNGIKVIQFPIPNIFGNVMKLISYNTTQMWAVFSFIPIFFYNGKKGKYSLKWFFYSIYPIHLIILYLLDVYVF